MTDYIEEIYLQFRLMVETLLRMNIDYSKKTDEKELKIVKNWLDKNMGSEILENDFFKSLYYQVLDHSYLKKLKLRNLKKNLLEKTLIIQSLDIVSISGKMNKIGKFICQCKFLKKSAEIKPDPVNYAA